MDLPSAPSTTTTILDLTDDCLLDVFQYFENYELLPLVDVCERFRQISQRHFACIPFHARGYKVNLYDLFFYELKIQPLRFIRVFGPLMRSISMIGSCAGDVPRVDSLKREMYMIQLLNTYCCSETLIELSLLQWNQTSEVTDAMQPWFQQLERLTIRWCKLSESFLQQPFEKLTSFSCTHMLIDELEKFLKSNPQLKKVQLLNNHLDDRIFQYIADHVPGIETILLRVINRTGDSNMQCLGKLSKLKSLALSSYPHGPDEFADFSSAVLREISRANSPLQKLHLASRYESPVMPRCADQLVDEISKLKMLKVLRWDGTPFLNRVRINQLCENLTELSELRLQTRSSHLDGYFDLNAQLILEIVGNARKLQSLYCYADEDKWMYGYKDRSLEEKCLINAQTYMKIVQMVKQRQEKLHLSVILGDYGYAANVPPELTKCHADALTLAVRKNRESFVINNSKW